MRNDGFESGKHSGPLSLQNRALGACDVTRRRFLKSLGAFGASAMLPVAKMAGQAPLPAAGAEPNRIDVHEHFFPPAYVKRVQENRNSSVAGVVGPRDWKPTASIAAMDKNGVATAIPSLSPGWWFGDAQEAGQLARACNEYGAQMVLDYPGRFGYFAALPLPDPEGSLREIEYAADVLKADGFGLYTSYGDKWPGDPAFAPVFEELNRRKAVVFIHPTSPNCCTDMIRGVPPSTLEFWFDITRAITSLLVNGVFERRPDIRFIFTHAGATMPVLATRINELLVRTKDLEEKAPQGIFYYIKKQYYEIHQAAYPPNMAAFRQVIPSSQWLFGSDFPNYDITLNANRIDQFGFSASELQAIHRENATRLFPRLKKDLA